MLLGHGNWGYVSNKAGGFWGYHWYWKGREYNGSTYEYYLQIESGKFCFKLCSYDPNLRREIRDYYRKQLFESASKHNIEIYKNGRIGKWMTVAALSSDFRKLDENGWIDMDRTIQEIRKIEKMLDSI